MRDIYRASTQYVKKYAPVNQGSTRFCKLAAALHILLNFNKHKLFKTYSNHFNQLVKQNNATSIKLGEGAEQIEFNLTTNKSIDVELHEVIHSILQVINLGDVDVRYGISVDDVLSLEESINMIFIDDILNPYAHMFDKDGKEQPRPVDSRCHEWGDKFVWLNNTYDIVERLYGRKIICAFLQYFVDDAGHNTHVTYAYRSSENEWFEKETYPAYKRKTTKDRMILDRVMFLLNGKGTENKTVEFVEEPTKEEFVEEPTKEELSPHAIKSLSTMEASQIDDNEMAAIKYVSPPKPKPIGRMQLRSQSDTL
jgi:hypothetical protein